MGSQSFLSVACNRLRYILCQKSSSVSGPSIPAGFEWSQDAGELHIRCLPESRRLAVLVLVGRSLEALDHLRLRSLLRGFLRETRSYFLRILWRLEKRPDIFPGRGLPALQKMPDGSWAENIRTRACMMGIESLLAGLAWATILDCRAMEDAWHDGAEWALCNSGTQDRHDKARDTSV